MNIIKKILIGGGVLVFMLSGFLLLPRQISVPIVSPLVSEKIQTEYITIDMTYPESSLKKYPEMFSFIQKSKNDFLDDFGNISPVDAKIINIGGERKYNYMMTTKIATSTKSVTYSIYVYTFTGGAHGGTTVNTFTYDTKGKYLTLDNIFLSPYVQKISALARTYFYDKLGEYAQKEMIDSGTEPIAEHYSSWYLTDKNIVFIFGQYSVGPYVLGIQEFPLDKKLISESLLPAFR